MARGTRELRLWFVALLFCPGCLAHLIVLRFGDAFLEHLRTLAPSLVIFVFSARWLGGINGLTAIRRAFSYQTEHRLPTVGRPLQRPEAAQ